MQAPEAAKPRLLPTLSESGGALLDAGSSGGISVRRPPARRRWPGSRSCSGWRSSIYALTVRHNGWLFYQGGDQIWLVTTGWLLGQGELGPTYVGYGWPLAARAAHVRCTGPSFVDAMPPGDRASTCSSSARSLLWAIYELGGADRRRAFGLFAAAAWVVLPFAVIPLWRDDYHERYIEQFLPGALGLTGLADFQSMVLLLVGLACSSCARSRPARPLDGGRRGARGRLRRRHQAVERALRRGARRRSAARAQPAAAAAVRARARCRRC